MNLDRARRSLEGLALGDAYGQAHFRSMPASVDDLAPPTWRWTDDTHMALSIVEVMGTHGRIDQDAIAAAFTRRHSEEPMRGYAGGAQRLLFDLAAGGEWRELAPALFPNGGSYGNGGAMRVAPLGAFFRGHPLRAAKEAALSAAVTHAHPEGQAGAIAVAVAASLLDASIRSDDFLDQCADSIPPGETRDGIALARSIPRGDFDVAARKLGTGHEVSAPDTVPFCVWMVAHERDYAQALWRTVRGGGDCDTTCAIVGGSSRPPAFRCPRTGFPAARPCHETARELVPERVDGFEFATSYGHQLVPEQVKRVAQAAFAIVLLYALALAGCGLLARPKPAAAAIVFGNTVDREGRPSKRLEARLEAARQLHGRRMVRWILVSGGRGKEGHDEAAVMAAWLTAHGVPDSSILVDHEGVTTEATCANARRMLGPAAVDVVTQWFHVPRAERTAARAGLEVRGAAWPPYAEPRDAYSFARELIAYPAYLVGYRSGGP